MLPSPFPVIADLLGETVALRFCVLEEILEVGVIELFEYGRTVIGVDRAGSCVSVAWWNSGSLRLEVVS